MKYGLFPIVVVASVLFGASHAEEKKHLPDTVQTLAQRKEYYTELAGQLSTTAHAKSILLQLLYDSEQDHTALDALLHALRTSQAIIPSDAYGALMRHTLAATPRGPHWMNRMRIVAAALDSRYGRDAQILANYCAHLIALEPRVAGIPHSAEYLRTALHYALWAELRIGGDRTPALVLETLRKVAPLYPETRARQVHALVQRTASRDLVRYLQPLAEVVRGQGAMQSETFQLLSKRLMDLLALRKYRALQSDEKDLLGYAALVLIEKDSAQEHVRPFLLAVANSDLLLEATRQTIHRELAQKDADLVQQWTGETVSTSLHCIQALRKPLKN